MKKAYEPRYYGVGSNAGIAVFTHWALVEDAKKYLAYLKVRKFSAFEEAQAYAFSVAAVEAPRGRVLPSSLVLNELVFYKDCPLAKGVKLYA